jgi:hypothetical protein
VDATSTSLEARVQGWPAGLYLAALYLRQGAPFGRVAASFGGDDQFVSEYLESEFLSRISARQRAFLTRTAVLERMCGSLCDAVLELSGSAGELTDLARSNPLLVPLDRRGKWYRYRGDVQAARQHLVSAQRARHLLTHAVPHMAVQARIELTRVHLALGDLAGARTAPDLAIALGYDVAAALEELDQVV